MCILNKKQRRRLLLSDVESFQKCRKVIYRFSVALLPKVRSMGGGRFQYTTGLPLHSELNDKRPSVLCRAGLRPFSLAVTWEKHRRPFIERIFSKTSYQGKETKLNNNHISLVLKVSDISWTLRKFVLPKTNWGDDYCFLQKLTRAAPKETILRWGKEGGGKETV